MQHQNMNTEQILEKLGIKKLNAMQEEAIELINSNQEIVLLSPTGTGKTLAFLLPMMAGLDRNIPELQCIILAPSRELAIQIDQVARKLGTGFKVNAVYGGRAGSQDRIDLKHKPAVLVGTPGRIADHIRREHFSTEFIQTLILDEFDKSLEIGFEKDMVQIVRALPNVRKKILTSATQKLEIPEFVGMSNPVTLDKLDEEIQNLRVKSIVSPTKDKLRALVSVLKPLSHKQGIVFCNFKDSIQEVSAALAANDILHGCFHGGMEQMDRENVLIKFRNGTHQLILATDLAARGIDVPEMEYIIHYQLPRKSHEFLHRNGRTARMGKDGTAYVLRGPKEELPDFVYPKGVQEEIAEFTDIDPKEPEWTTLYISGGRRDKISKGDIAGFFLKQGGLDMDELGLIEIKQEGAFVAVKKAKAQETLNALNNTKLKKKKLRIRIL